MNLEGVSKGLIGEEFLEPQRSHSTIPQMMALSVKSDQPQIPNNQDNSESEPKLIPRRNNTSQPAQLMGLSRRSRQFHQLSAQGQKEVIDMRKAIYDLKKKCRSLKNQVKNIGGKKVYRMLHSINEREEAAKEEIKEEDE